MYLESRDETANSTVLPPKPYVFAPSGSWDGNDGKWSTFLVNTGDPQNTGNGQNFRVLISTSSPVTQLPVQAPWCDDAECAKRRGIELYDAQPSLSLDTDPSTGWQELGLYSFPFPPYWSAGNLNGTWGTMPVGLGATSKDSYVQPDQLVVQNGNEQLFMGTFGLAYIGVSTGSPTEHYPWLRNMNASKAMFSSASYGYAAGASYKNGGKGMLGSLVLGGYDLSRFQNTSRIDIGFPNPSNTSLVVSVQDILYHPDRNVDANDYSLTQPSNDAFNAVIDSGLPYLEMPENICNNFADKFQLTYDEDRNLYTVNTSAHDYNIEQKATVTFKIGKDSDDTNNSTSIQLPYAAFDLEGNAPLFPNTTKYFPLRRAMTGQNVLGRAFLQETYIIVDYENWRFAVAPATSSDPMPSADIEPIYWKGYQLPTSGENGSGSGLSGGAIAGVVVGILAVLGLLGTGAFLFWKRRRRQQRKLDEKGSENDIDTVQAGEQVKVRRISELDSEAPSSPKTSVGGYYNRERKDDSPFPPISEMESPPAELYSPPPESLAALSTETPQSERDDYFIVGNKVRRRGATRESSGQNSPGTPAVPIAELPGDDGKFTVDGQHFEPVASPVQSPVHSRGGSEASQASGRDHIVAGARDDTGERSNQRRSQSRARDSSVPSNIDEVMARHKGEAERSPERAPSHSRVRSDTTVASESTAVSQPTPEELETWAMGSDEPRRPLSE